MPTPLDDALASIASLQSLLSAAETVASAAYQASAAVERELTHTRGLLALYMATNPPEAGVTDNAKGFAQNVAHALDGLDRVLSDGSRSALATVTARRDFANQIASWQAAVAAPPSAPPAP